MAEGWGQGRLRAGHLRGPWADVQGEDPGFGAESQETPNTGCPQVRSATSSRLAPDASAPHPGGFMPHTKHPVPPALLEHTGSMCNWDPSLWPKDAKDLRGTGTRCIPSGGFGGQPGGCVHRRACLRPTAGRSGHLLLCHSPGLLPGPPAPGGCRPLFQLTALIPCSSRPRPTLWSCCSPAC